VPELAEHCVIELEERETTRSRRAVAKADLASNGGRPATDVCIAEATSALPSHVPDDAVRLTLPLSTRHGRLGTFELWKRSEAFSEADRLLAQELGQRIALAIENSLLYREAQKAARQRERVLAVVTHDLRSPLSNILLGASMLATNPQVRAKPVGHDVALRIARAGQRMQRLLRDLLDVTTLETGELVLKPSRHRVADIFDEVADLYEPLAQEKRLTLRIEPPAQPLDVFCDSDRLVQVIGNLLGNALKFTPAGGEISLRAELSPGGLSFVVTDSGPGIAQDAIPHLFEPYWKIDRADRRGAGLGLSIAKALIEAQGGQIWVESVLGRGSAFHFTLPSAFPLVPTVPAAEAAASTTASTTAP
jgi:signal transduction histidine kinase